MANRAYLYTSDRADAWERPDDNYYDSRWTIPLAWFFFYRPEDIRLIDVRSGTAHWQEVKCSAEKRPALARFKTREPLLLSLIEGRISRETVAEFLHTIERFPGRFLLMDPDQVLPGTESDSIHAERLGRILTLIESGDDSREAILEAAQMYVGRFDPCPDRCECQIIGYTYLS